MKHISKIILISLILLSGCASIENGRYQTITVETTHNGKPEPGADCMLANHRGDWKVKTPGKISVRRSHNTLEVLCEKEGFNPGKLTVKSIGHKKTLAKSALVGGVTGMGIDHINGALYDYPPVIQVPLTHAEPEE